MKLVKNISIILITLLLLVLVGLWISQQGTKDNKNGIEFIKSRSYNGKVLDFQNEVSVKSVEDVKYYYDKHGNIIIEYGKVLLKYKTKDFITEEVQKDLNDVFITVEQHPETYEFIIFFQGEEIIEYVKR